MIFYTYLYLREDGTPYYVGKGTRTRVYQKHGRIPVPPKDRILIEPHISEADAFDAEKFLVAYYGRKDLGTGCLRNLTDGGEGSSGGKRPDNAARLIRQNHLRRGIKLGPRPAEIGKKISAAKLGKRRPDMVGNRYALSKVGHWKGKRRPDMVGNRYALSKGGRWKGHIRLTGAERTRAYRQRQKAKG